ncbi:MAG: DUF349 domain-containing protein [Erysipelotrichaceae bacterium]|jgi:hypothetical protein
MVEYSDLDLNLKRKEELVKKAKRLSESDNVFNAVKTASSLKKQWKRFPEYESGFEVELREEFDEYLALIEAKKNELSLNAAETKAAIIEKSKEILETTNYRKATKEMNDLFNQWKITGSAGKEVDDELWAQYKEVRDTFFDNRREYYANLDEKRAEAKEAKEAIIAELQQLATSTEWKKTTRAINDLLEKWKAAGSAGRKDDEELWKQFSAARKSFNQAKNAYYAELKASFADRAVQKEELIAEAKLCTAQCDFSEEMIEKVKGLRTRWKEIGFCGVDRDNELYSQFNEAVNNFFQNLKDHKEY